MDRVFQHVWDDLEALLDSGFGDGWEYRYLQLGRGSLSGWSSRVNLSEIEIHQYCYGTALHVQECLKEDACYITFPIAADNEIYLFGKPFESGHALIYSPESEVDLILPRDLHTVGILISTSWLDRFGLRVSGTSVVRMPPGMQGRLAEWSGRLGQWLKWPELPGAVTMDLLEERLASDLAGLLGGERAAASGKPAPRFGPVARAVSFMQDMPHEGSLDIAALSHAAGVSERSLYRGFRDAFGVGPYEYFTLLRLRRFRQRLRHAGKGEPARGVVTRLATDSGFNHLGRFSQRYRQQFGETPRATLKRWVADDRALAHPL